MLHVAVLRPPARRGRRGGPVDDDRNDGRNDDRKQ